MNTETAVPKILAGLEELRTKLPLGPLDSDAEVRRVSDLAANCRAVALQAKALRDRILAPFKLRVSVITQLWQRPIDVAAEIERKAIDAVSTALSIARAKNEAAQVQRQAAEAAAFQGVQQVFQNVGMTVEESNAATEKAMARVEIAPAQPRMAEVAKTATATVSLRKATKWEVADLSLLPDEYIIRTPDRAKITAAVRAGTTVPGVRTWQETGASIRGVKA